MGTLTNSSPMVKHIRMLLPVSPQGEPDGIEVRAKDDATKEKDDNDTV